MTKASQAGMSAAAAKWSRQIERQKQSGLSVRAFADREGLKAGSLSFWRWKLAHDSRRSGKPVRFVELTTEVGSSSASRFEVVLRSGRRVRVPGGFERQELARLVQVLEEVCS